MKNLKNILFIFSAFMPIYVLVVTKLFVQLQWYDKRVDSFVLVQFATILLFVALGVVGLLINTNHGEIVAIKPTRTKNITASVALPIIAFMIVIASIYDFYNEISFIALVVGIVLFIVVIFKNQLFYINPLLILCGYSIYEVEYINKHKHSTIIAMSRWTEIDKHDELKIKVGDRGGLLTKLLSRTIDVVEPCIVEPQDEYVVKKSTKTKTTKNKSSKQHSTKAKVGTKPIKAK